MSKSSLLIGACTRAPRLSRFAVRAFHRLGGVVPQKAVWIDMLLKRRLCENQGRRVVRIGGGLKAEVDLSSSVGRAIYFHGSYEPAVARYLSGVLRPGMVAVDAGANIGELSVRMASLVRPTGHVVAVEPSPNTFTALVRNVKLNALNNVHCECVALGAKEERRTFYVERECHSLASSMFPSSGREAAATETSVTTIDRLCERLGYPRVDLIKLDIEGAELEAIAGSATMLQSSRPPTLIVEFNQEVAARAGWRCVDLISALEKYEYRPYLLNQNGTLCDFDVNSIESPNGIAKLDLVAVPSRNGRQ